MAVRLVCRACGKRLKLPDGANLNRAAKCPKCRAPVDLTAALEASAYLPTVSRQPPLSLGDDGPPTYPVAKPAARPSPPPLPPTPSRPPLAQTVPRPLSLPSIAEVGEVLSLDDDPPADLPAEPEPPFRVPVRVLADSLRQVAGPCFAVFVPHGVFLEHEPMKPFLYVPVGCPAEAPATGELIVTLPDGARSRSESTAGAPGRSRATRLPSWRASGRCRSRPTTAASGGCCCPR